MSTCSEPNRTRRAFLRMLAASPLFAAMPNLDWQSLQDYVISDPSEAINVLDFEAAARKALPPAHWGYLTTGVDDDATLKANREGFSHYQLRSRRLVDVSKIDMSVDMFGTKWETPIVLAPSGTLFHPEGPLPVARAAQKQKTLMILGGVQERTHPIDEVMRPEAVPSGISCTHPRTCRRRCKTSNAWKAPVVRCSCGQWISSVAAISKPSSDLGFRTPVNA